MDKSVTNPSGEIFIVDNDPGICAALWTAITQAGYQATVFTDGQLFIRAARTQVPACVLLDRCMPSSSGSDTLTELDADNYPAPVLILSNQSDIPRAVEAIRNGAFDFIDKRLDADTIVGRMREAVDRWARRRQNNYVIDFALPSLPGYDRLTSREREVLFQITAAASIKETGRSLGISPRTVAVHRRRIMQKLGAKNSVNLIRTVLNTVHNM
jgi:two-component system, LuxR family, response regulator FixJ